MRCEQINKLKCKNNEAIDFVKMKCLKLFVIKIIRMHQIKIKNDYYDCDDKNCMGS